MSSILLSYKVTDVYVISVCMHVIYLPVPTSFAVAVAVSPFPPSLGSHLKEVLTRGSRAAADCSETTRLGLTGPKPIPKG